MQDGTKVNRQRLADRALRSLFGVAMAMRAKVASSPQARALLYDLRNRRMFTDLYQHDRMVGDSVRVDAYERAIAKYVREGDVVVDLGTGSGILSFLASKSRPSVIHAIETRQDHRGSASGCAGQRN